MRASLGAPDARQFALRSLDRILAEAWDAERGLSHVIAYSDPNAEKRFVAGLLDDYAYTAIACLDAYEITGDFSYFRFAQQDRRRNDPPLCRSDLRRILRHRSFARRRS